MGEKNLSDNRKDNSDLKLEPTVRTHCFPEIKMNKTEEQSDSKNLMDRLEENQFGHDIQSGEEAQPWPRPSSDTDPDEIEQLLNKARQDGYEIGFEEGRDQEMKRVDALADTISKMVLETEKYKAQLLLQGEKSVIKLVVAIANKIILSEPSLNPDVILTVAKNALKMVIDPSFIKIKANPMDLETLEKNKGFLENLVGKSSTVKIEADTGVLAGGCIVQTDFGDIDARLETQMLTMEQMLDNELRLSIQKKAP